MIHMRYSRSRSRRRVPRSSSRWRLLLLCKRKGPQTRSLPDALWASGRARRLTSQTAEGGDGWTLCMRCKSICGGCEARLRTAQAHVMLTRTNRKRHGLMPRQPSGLPCPEPHIGGPPLTMRPRQANGHIKSRQGMHMQAIMLCAGMNMTSSAYMVQANRH